MKTSSRILKLLFVYNSRSMDSADISKQNIRGDERKK